MRTSLDHLPRRKQAELARVKDVVFDEFERMRQRAESEWKLDGRILKLILFGSYARGTWVEDPRHDGGYFSDYDIMIVVNDDKLLLPDCDLWWRVEDRLMTDPKVITPVNLITETLSNLNDRLTQGHFFFTDVVAQGIALFESSRGKGLATKRDLNPEEALAVAKEHYEHWMPRARNFLDGHDFYMTKGESHYREAAFSLHQATECAYDCLLAVLGNYVPPSHNLKHLRSLAEIYDDRLIDIWPRATKADEKPFERLKDAYIKARYAKVYEITAEELELLRARVLMVHDLVELLCEESFKVLCGERVKSDHNL